MVHFQIFTIPRFFRLSFQFYPEKRARICELTLHRTQIREKIRDLRKILDIKGLRLKMILSSYKKHHIGTRYRPFQGLICTITHPETGITSP